MNTTATAEAVQDTDAKKPRSGAVHPEKPIEGFVFIQPGESLHNSKDKGANRGVSRYLHGLVVPGIGQGRKRNSQETVLVPRNRMLIPDRDCYQWFKNLLDQKVLPAEFEGVGIRCNVKTLLNDNVAFIRPTPRSAEQALMEWRTRELELREHVTDVLQVTDNKSLATVFYSRAVRSRSNIILSRILPNRMTALAVMKNGFFYELSGAERLKKHIGRAGTNGMILDRDIEAVFRFNQIYDMNVVQAMLNDPEGFSL
jgi:hypothetical protein